MILNKLEELANSDFYPFHMPGHKRNVECLSQLGIWKENLNPYRVDITEIPEFDDLHEAEGIIKKAQEMASALYGAKKTFFQVNGSTGAILSAIGGATKRGDSVLVARNCHKSVYHALELYGLTPVYLTGEIGEEGIFKGITLTEVLREIRHAKEMGLNIRLLILTSPTYEGFVSEIKEIAKLTEREGILFMVDEAHGAHFGLSKSGYFPETAVRLGADIVVQSLHKTLPSFTQTALLHLPKENALLAEKIKKRINMFETSSPSYLFLAGIESCLTAIAEKGKEIFCSYETRLKDFYNKTKHLEFVKVVGEDKCKDAGKLVISAGYGSGSYLYDYFYQECKLVMEMKSKDYVIAMTSIFDTKEGFERLSTALIQLDEKIRKLAKEGIFYYTFEEDSKNLFSFDIARSCSVPKRKRTPYEASVWIETYGEEYLSPLEETKGRVASRTVYFYPPGIPLIVAGEVIDEEVIRRIKEGRQADINIYGGSDGNGIFVCADREECNR